MGSTIGRVCLESVSTLTTFNVAGPNVAGPNVAGPNVAGPN